MGEPTTSPLASCGPLLERYSRLREIAREVVRLGSAEARARTDIAAEELLGSGGAAKLRRLHPADPRAWEALDSLEGFTLAYLTDLVESRRDAAPLSPADVEWVGCDPRLRAIRARLPHHATSRVPLLLVGERGTGKTSLARALHEKRSGSPDQLYIVAAGDVGTGELAGSHLFGHVKGAFTGAVRERRGILALAHSSGGTVLLDDLGEYPPQVQVLLLGVLQHGSYFPVGSDEPVHVGARGAQRFKLCVASQPKSLGKMRPDLLGRVSVDVEELPPLRERGLDMLVLAEREVQRAAAKEGRSGLSLDPSAWPLLLSHHWSGNVRELQNVIWRAVARLPSGERLLRADVVARSIGFEEQLLKRNESGDTAAAATPEGASAVTDIGRARHFPTLEDAERRHIDEALRLAHGNVSRAARMLGLPRSTLQSRMKALGWDGASSGWR